MSATRGLAKPPRKQERGSDHGEGKRKGKGGLFITPIYSNRALPVLLAKLVNKIFNGDFIDKAELHRRLKALAGL